MRVLSFLFLFPYSFLAPIYTAYIIPLSSEGRGLFNAREGLRLNAKRRIKASITQKKTDTSPSSELKNEEEEGNAGQSISPLGLSDSAIKELLRQDISQFSSLSNEKEKTSSSSSAMTSLKNAFAVFLIADFFVVIVFLIWFLAAAAMQSTNPFLLERFQDIFNPVVVPSLTVLMVGSILSGTFSNEGEKK